MKQLDNIGNFFRKRLIDSESIEQEWNIPSDDIWAAAEPHFPKEKLNRKCFVFFFTSVCILSSILIITLKPNSNNIKEQSNNIVVKENNLISTDNKNRQQTESIEKSKDAKFNKKDIVKKVVTQETHHKNNGQIIDNKISEVVTASSAQNNDDVIQRNATKKGLSALSGITTYDVKIDSSLLPNKETKDSPFIANSLQIDRQRQISNIAQNANEGSSPNKSELVNILILDRQDLKALQFSNSSLISELPSLIYIEQSQNQSRWEIGLALSQFNKRPDWIIEELLDKGDSYDLQSKQLGFNLSLTKLVSKRFSYTTGLMFNDLDFDLNITDDQNFGDDVTLEVLKKRIRDFVKVGNLSVNGNGRDIIIEFLSENDLRKGDVLNLRATFPINFKLYQLPFILNYRVIKNRWEWNVSGGISLDFVNVNVDNINVEVLKDGVNTINPVVVNPISDLSLAASLYLGSSVKYEVYPKLSFGLQSRLDITELRLSKYELGLYYKL